jgi:hypothetical protein
MRNKTLNERMAKDIGRKIIAFTEKLDVHVSSYVMDLAFVNGDIYFIELNPFGSEYGSGSSLFH